MHVQKRNTKNTSRPFRNMIHSGKGFPFVDNCCSLTHGLHHHAEDRADTLHDTLQACLRVLDDQPIGVGRDPYKP